MTFPMERQYLAKERAADMYRLSAYYLSSTISDCLAELIYPTIFMVILYFMAGLRRSIAAFLLTLLATYLIGVTGQVTPMKPSSPLLIDASEMLWIDQLSEINVVDFYKWTEVDVHLCECKPKMHRMWKAPTQLLYQSSVPIWLQRVKVHRRFIVVAHKVSDHHLDHHRHHAWLHCHYSHFITVGVHQ